MKTKANKKTAKVAVEVQAKKKARRANPQDKRIEGFIEKSLKKYTEKLNLELTYIRKQYDNLAESYDGIVSKFGVMARDRDKVSDFQTQVISADRHDVKNQLADIHKRQAEILSCLSTNKHTTQDAYSDSWNPPETAPKDGTMIIGDFGWKDARLAVWSGKDECWKTPEIRKTHDDEEDYESYFESEGDCDFLRWMPFPGKLRDEIIPHNRTQNETHPTTMTHLIQQIRQWGEAKGITGPHGKATILTQLAKTQEELTETRDASVMLALIEEFDEAKNGDYDLPRDIQLLDLKDGIGDCTVTLILAADLAGLDFEDCLRHAYDQIKGRTGQMIDGTFVKN
jgi:NTP pyrophosphatase (non-canonical NTP hydrolase)